MKVFEAIAAELRRQEVRQVFGLVGEDVAKFVAILAEHDISFYSVHHESAAVGMADGFSRVTGRVGVAIVSRGPGFTNSLTALTSAAKGHSRILVFAADTAIGVQGQSAAASSAKAPKHVLQGAIAAGAGVPHVQLQSAATAVADVRELISRAQNGTPIAVNIPMDILAAEAGSEESQVALAEELEKIAPSPEAIAEVADLLEATWASGLPAIVAGRGAVVADARHELEVLGERCGAIMATTLKANSMFAGNEYNVGMIGTFATPGASELVGRAQVVLAFGASLNALTTFGGQMFPKATIVQFDADPAAFGRFISPALAVRGDVCLAAAALNAELDKRGYRNRGFRTDRLASRVTRPDEVSDIADQSLPDAIDPRTLLRVLSAKLPADRTVVTDAGHHMAFTASNVSVPAPESFIWPLDYSAVGSGLGVGLGAAVGNSSRLTVLFVGDGGLMMTLGDLETAVRYAIPLVVVVINDAAYGAEVHFLELDGLPSSSAKLTDVSFAGIAAALGAESMTVRRIVDLEGLEERLKDMHGPLVIDCKVNPSVRADFISVWHALTQPLRGSAE